jgi:hypothetical protein
MHSRRPACDNNHVNKVLMFDALSTSDNSTTAVVAVLSIFNSREHYGLPVFSLKMQKPGADYRIRDTDILAAVMLDKDIRRGIIEYCNKARARRPFSISVVTEEEGEEKIRTDDVYMNLFFSRFDDNQTLTCVSSENLLTIYTDNKSVSSIKSIHDIFIGDFVELLAAEYPYLWDSFFCKTVLKKMTSRRYVSLLHKSSIDDPHYYPRMTISSLPKKPHTR